MIHTDESIAKSKSQPQISRKRIRPMSFTYLINCGINLLIPDLAESRFTKHLARHLSSIHLYFLLDSVIEIK